MKVFLILLFSSAALGLVQSTEHVVSSPVPTSLAMLIDEAQRNNPGIQASVHEYRAASNGAKGAGALPDTQLMLQQLNVGSPRPFAGYTNSDFAYIGIGASQQLPWPGKRSLRAAPTAMRIPNSRVRWLST
jgi:cobalt-zinc-cadmium efflux system outer membrane protein